MASFLFSLTCDVPTTNGLFHPTDRSNPHDGDIHKPSTSKNWYSISSLVTPALKPGKLVAVTNKDNLPALNNANRVALPHGALHCSADTQDEIYIQLAAKSSQTVELISKGHLTVAFGHEQRDVLAPGEPPHPANQVASPFKTVSANPGTNPGHPWTFFNTSNESPTFKEGLTAVWILYLGQVVTPGNFEFMVTAAFEHSIPGISPKFYYFGYDPQMVVQTVPSR